MAITALKRLFSGAKPIIALIVLILTALGMLSDAIHGSTNLDTLFTTLLIINVLAIILLVAAAIIKA